MGTVCLAARADGQFEQHVAIKFVKRGMDSEEILRRFAEERRTLATLIHPHIAQLLDGGVAPDGRPYLVMEYVKGVTITHYCDENLLSTTRRLRLFCGCRRDGVRRSFRRGLGVSCVTEGKDGDEERGRDQGPGHRGSFLY